MPYSEQHHHKSKKSEFQILIVPQGDASKGRSFKVTIPIIIAGCVGVSVLIAVITILLLKFTPLGIVIPISQAELAKRYEKEVSEVQQQLFQVSKDVVMLQEYNRKLRSILGEQNKKDTTAFVSSEEKFEENTVLLNSSSVRGSSNKEIKSSSQFAISFQASFPIISPVSGYISRGFENEQNHFGIDYAGKIGSVINAVADGYVIFSGWTYEDGNMLIIAHGSGYFSIYKHNQSLLTFRGDFVKRGQAISLLGNSGKTSYGAHLHFELWKNGIPQNPENFLIATKSL